MCPGQRAALLSSFVKMCAGAWTSTRPPAAAGISFAFLMARRAQRQPLSASRPSCRSDQLVSGPRTLASRQACASAAKCPAQMTEVEGEDDRTVQNQSSCADAATAAKNTAATAAATDCRFTMAASSRCMSTRRRNLTQELSLFGRWALRGVSILGDSFHRRHWRLGAMQRRAMRRCLQA